MSQQIYVSITPSDSTTYTPGITTLFVQVAGNVQVLGVSGQGAYATNDAQPVVLGLPVGKTVLPFPVSMIYATNTTATGIVGLQGQ